MSPPQYRKIKNGTLAVSLVDPAALGYTPDWMTPDGSTDLDALDPADYTDGPADASWKCQVTEAFVSASSNTSTEDVPDGWCGPGTTNTDVKGSSFALNLTWVQDEFLDGGGLVGFAYDNDAEEAYFLIAGDAAAGSARLAGRCWIIAGQVFGPAGAINTSTAVWNCDTKPLASWPVAVAAQQASPAAAAVPYDEG